MPRAGLTSAGVLSVDAAPRPRLPLSSDAGKIDPPRPPPSFDGASCQRDSDVKLTMSSTFFSNVSRVLSANMYRGDLSSCRFYGSNVVRSKMGHIDDD